MLRLFWLGKFRAERDGAPIPDAASSRPGARQLLKRLALRADHELHTQQVIDVRWPDLDATAARDDPGSTPSATAREGGRSMTLDQAVGEAQRELQRA